MNIPNQFERGLQAHSLLKRELSTFAKRALPPVTVRRELMRTVRDEAASQGHHSLRQPSDGFIETVYLGPVITFNHCFHMFHTLHSRIRL